MFLFVENIPQQQNAMRSLRNIDFGVFWARAVPARNRVKGTGSGNPFWVTGFPVAGKQFQGSGSGFRWVPTGIAAPRSKKPGSGRQGSGFRRLCARGFEGFGARWVPTVGFCSRGLDGTGSGNQFWKPEVLRRFQVPQIPFPMCRKLLCALKEYFCTLKRYFVN